MHQIHFRIKFREKPPTAEATDSCWGKEEGVGGWDAHRWLRGAIPRVWGISVLRRTAPQ